MPQDVTQYVYELRIFPQPVNWNMSLMNILVNIVLHLVNLHIKYTWRHFKTKIKILNLTTEYMNSLADAFIIHDTLLLFC